jgi:surface antigen
VRPGDVAIFRSMGAGHGHVAVVESLNYDRNRRPISINVSEMNARGPLDKCARGPDFGIVRSGRYDISRVSGYWRP